MRFFFHEDAEFEFDRTVAYYEGCQKGLGINFSQEIYSAIERIVQFPEAWSLISKNTRRCMVNRFPFGIIYQLESGCIRIIAVADMRRRPGYWKSRV